MAATTDPSSGTTSGNITQIQTTPMGVGCTPGSNTVCEGNGQCLEDNNSNTGASCQAASVAQDACQLSGMLLDELGRPFSLLVVNAWGPTGIRTVVTGDDGTFTVGVGCGATQITVWDGKATLLYPNTDRGQQSSVVVDSSTGSYFSDVVYHYYGCQIPDSGIWVPETACITADFTTVDDSEPFTMQCAQSGQFMNGYDPGDGSVAFPEGDCTNHAYPATP
jgi:hypothetical protein